MCEKNLVYTVYIQSAENRQKSESLSKNKFSKIGQCSVANQNEFYKLSNVVRKVRFQITKRERE